MADTNTVPSQAEGGLTMASYNGIELPDIPEWPYEHYSPPNERFPYAIIEPNRITGEGRCKGRPWSASKAKDLKKKEHRKMAKKSRRQNRRA